MKNRKNGMAAPFLLAAALAWFAPAGAQQAPAPADAPLEQPAMDGGEMPSVAAEPAPAPAKGPKVGTDIVGERESPIGLFITPWKDSGAETALERPARLLQEELLPIDEDVFIRNLEYYEALSGALKSKKAVTPPTPLAPSNAQPPPSAGTPAVQPSIQP